MFLNDGLSFEWDGLKRSGLSLSETVGEVIMPGDEFEFPSGGDGGKVVLGPGLKLLAGRAGADNQITKDRIVACRGGILAKIKQNTYLIELKTKSYESYKNDDVVGMIKQKGKGDQYTVDVGTRERAQLSKSAFEGATKKFRPDLLVGDVVYGKVVDLPKDFPMELTCVHSSGKALGLGSLEGGNVIDVPVHFTRVLRNPIDKENILKKIGKIVPCETAVGANGLVWVKAKNAVVTVLVSQLIQKLGKSKVEDYDDLLKQFRKGMASLNM